MFARVSRLAPSTTRVVGRFSVRSFARTQRLSTSINHKSSVSRRFSSISSEQQPPPPSPETNMSPVNPKQQGSVLRSILDDDTRQLVQDEKRVLTTVCDRLAETDGSDPDIALLRTIVKQLDELFMLVVVGEFNSGKSSFINTLLGEFIYLFILILFLFRL